MNCIVVDDDAMSVKSVELFISKTEFLTHVGSFTDPKKAAAEVAKLDVDLIFLDVMMPEMNGFDFLKSLPNPPQVILISSKGEFGVQAFDADVTDYLLKPLDYSRFLKASLKAKENNEMRLNGDRQIFVKSNFKWIRIDFEKFYFVEAMADYVTIHTETDKYVVHSTMKGIAERLPSNIFARVHRSYIVNVNKIDLIEDNEVKMLGTDIPIGAFYKESFRRKINML